MVQISNDTKIVVGEERALARLPLKSFSYHISRKTIGRWVTPSRKEIAMAMLDVAATRLEVQIKAFVAMTESRYTVEKYGSEMNLDAATMRSYALLKFSFVDL